MIRLSRSDHNVPNPDLASPVYPFLIENGHRLISSSKNIYLNLIFRSHWNILRDASLKPIFKGHSLLFILARYCFKYTVHGTKFRYTVELSYRGGNVRSSVRGPFKPARPRRARAINLDTFIFSTKFSTMHCMRVHTHTRVCTRQIGSVNL